MKRSAIEHFIIKMTTLKTHVPMLLLWAVWVVVLHAYRLLPQCTKYSVLRRSISSSLEPNKNSKKNSNGMVISSSSIQMVVEKRAEVGGQDISSLQDLYDAAKDGNLERVMQLVEQGADKNQVGGKFGDSALSAATENNNLSVVRFLVEQGADLELADVMGWTPLIDASRHGHLEVARYLLEQGANTEKATNHGFTSLHYAVMFGHLEIAKLLMSFGADINARNSGGKLPIEMGHRNTEEIRQAIRDESRRRMDQQSLK